MNWILLSLLTALLYTAIYIIDKLLMDSYVKNHYLAAAISGFSTSIFFCIVAFLKINISVFVGNYLGIIIGIFAGVSNALVILLYYYLMTKEEISRFTPIFSLTPAFVVILSYFLLNESFSNNIYIGILLIIIESVLISIKKSSQKIKLSSVFLLSILAAFGFALKNTLIKLGSTYTDIYVVNFWLGIAAGIMGLLFLIKYFPKTDKEKKGAKILLGVDMISALTFFVLSLALSKGPASLVTSMMQMKVVFTFIVAVYLTIFFPKFLKETITKNIIIQKTLAIIIIIIGAILIIN